MMSVSDDKFALINWRDKQLCLSTHNDMVKDRSRSGRRPAVGENEVTGKAESDKPKGSGKGLDTDYGQEVSLAGLADQ